MITITSIWWILCSGIVGISADWKGRSFILYFIVSMVFSPLIALLVLIAVGRPNQEIAKDEIEIASIKKKLRLNNADVETASGIQEIVYDKNDSDLM